MNAMVKETQTDKSFDELKTRLKSTWMTGDYDLFSRFMQKDAEQFSSGWESNREPGCSM